MEKENHKRRKKLSRERKVSRERLTNEMKRERGVFGEERNIKEGKNVCRIRREGLHKARKMEILVC